ncbi:MAG: amidohydrolase family protein, partial [Bryobacterales bacterium]|nr:amidohydrolase family protein [Bryobacterales bacterium]
MLAAAVLLITNVTVIDGTGAPPGAPQSILIRNGRIVSVNAPSLPPRDAEVLDGTGKFLIPGLWDMHTHVLADAGRAFPKLLAAGVTGIRNMHEQAQDALGLALRIRREVEREERIGPRIIANGPILDGPSPTYPGSIGVGDAAVARRTVRTLRSRGADFVKVYDLLPRDAYFAIAAEAGKARLPVAGHVPIWVSAEEAARSGQRSIEHLSGVFEACTADGNLDRQLKQAANLWAIARPIAAQQMHEVVRKAAATYDPSICHPLFLLFAEKRVWQCPTLCMLGAVQNAGMKVVRQMKEAGLQILAGTDAGNRGSEPGESLHRELELLVEAGLTPMEALQAATRNAAEYLGKQKEWGTIEKGKAADLVLLDANPLEDIRNTRRISAVVIRGRVLPSH